MTTLNDYQRAAARTRAGVDGMVLTAEQANLLLGALGAAGEAGEFADTVKKIMFHGHPMDRDHLIEELGDILWYLGAAADALDTTLAIIAYRNIEKLMIRYPQGFSSEASLNHADEVRDLQE